jgi:hypothetical protein
MVSGQLLQEKHLDQCQTQSIGSVYERLGVVDLEMLDAMKFI